MKLKDFLSNLSSCNVVSVFDSDCHSKRLAVFISDKWAEAEKSCVEKYGNCTIKTWYVISNQLDIYVKTDK